MLNFRNKIEKLFKKSEESEGLLTVNTELLSNSQINTFSSGLSAILLGELLIILDAISYGLLIFPSNQKYFENTGSDGISMFLVSTIVSQLLFAVTSQFKCVNGSMMIEVIPFLHTICSYVSSSVQPHQIMPTVMVSYALSSVMTGLVFFVLGYFKMGETMEFFPRHILIGTIGGVGWFLIQTAIEVTTQLRFHWDFLFIQELFEFRNIIKWGAALLSCVLLRLLQLKFKQTWFVSLYFCILPLLFYLVVFITNTPIDELKDNGWLFRMQVQTDALHFYKYVQFNNVDWSAIPPLLPTIVSMSFFGLLHVPINIPALAISTKTDINLDNELKAHGYSNVLAGLLFTNQNYLVYSNSVLFMKSGGNNRGLMVLLGLVTTLLWVFAMPLFQFLPMIVVGALIFHIGVDLLKESVYDTWKVVSISEYSSIILIIVSMMFIGFTEGVLIGVVCACIFFVVKSSQIKVIRSMYTGTTARSTVRRLYQQEKYLELMGSQIQIIQINGFLFFGTIRQINELLSQLLKEWDSNPIRYIILDLKLALGIDYSAAEAFMKIHDLTIKKRVFLILSGVNEEISHWLKKVGCWQNESDSNVVVVNDLNSALEWAENALLRSFYKLSQHVDYKDMIPMDINQMSYSPMTTFSPRQAMSQKAFQNVYTKPAEVNEDFNLLRSCIYEMGGNPDLYVKIQPYFKRRTFQKDSIYWSKNDASNNLGIIQKGLCLLTDDFDVGSVCETTILPGIIFGEMSMISNKCRATTATFLVDTTLWEMNRTKYEELRVADPLMLLEFITLMMAYNDLQMTHISRQLYLLNK
eukprot:NODE_367_length_10044_cov_0.769432.p1 type:complete len:807 gc:universal NODE_367_length_10044_cov_0.769432:5776-8196(+)